MNDFVFPFHGARLAARGSGALWWAEAGLLVVSDLHLGKSARMARRAGALLPPYDSRDTLARLEAELDATGARRVLCLGDSFDDLKAARGLEADMRDWLLRLSAGRDWIWIEGNHDPGPVDLPGTHLAALQEGALSFRHIATAVRGEISGHYHPKLRLPLRGSTLSRPCFLVDADRIILPAFGTYTGGLCTTDPALDGLMLAEALAIVTGHSAQAVPMPRGRSTPRQRHHA
ncbi:MAG: ligase-associated DNA damage response endonuclease PdeM [Rhodobacteraceae bacterium]|nr:ligase-associated DNA damage response endonuclease PdeM [Paracoccaceae bacterium]